MRAVCKRAVRGIFTGVRWLAAAARGWPKTDPLHKDPSDTVARCVVTPRHFQSARCVSVHQAPGHANRAHVTLARATSASESADQEHVNEWDDRSSFVVRESPDRFGLTPARSSGARCHPTPGILSGAKRSRRTGEGAACLPRLLLAGSVPMLLSGFALKVLTGERGGGGEALRDREA